MQRVDGVGDDIDRRQYNDFVVSVGASSGGDVPVEVSVTAMRRSAAHVGIAWVGSSVVEMVPARNLRMAGTSSGCQVFEPIGIRYTDRRAGCSICGCCRDVGVATVGGDTELIASIGQKVGNQEGVGVAGSTSERIGPGISVGRTIVDVP